MDDRRSAAGTPARGTRPRNRRQLILDAATSLFAERGYNDVAMGDVAEAVAIGPSALYRHFRGKQDLLTAVITQAIGQVEATVAKTDSSLPAALATVAVTQRDVGVLWRRESRHLTAHDYDAVRKLTRRFGDRVAKRIRDFRPELSPAESQILASCAISVSNSIAFHTLTLPEPAFTKLITELVKVPLQARVDFSDVRSPSSPGATHSRREGILAAAAALFADRGYAGVSVDDIGAAVGIAGPSVYNHFAAKADILSAIIFRGNEWLWMNFNQAAATASEPADVLRAVICSYRDFAFDNPHIVRILLSEMAQLPTDDRKRSSHAQHAYIDEWVHIVRQLRPDWPIAEARIRVQACQIMINDFVVTQRLRNQPGVSMVLSDIGFALLGLHD
ncbi:TetR family transcriptional regulator [Mycobacteroides stephanolepidis]|uniref:TetR family transcriptional regulator n=1 Tax=[Mycobacterium] stephanolepidis TaxID=1520670 RepID=A0A1Z4EWD6_9MYCO|nr:TetR/AcrR family transcriptional regulator [[Mycobacterium] stephanolepidis]BAX97275.1 TetR family transcriptional regulator [[Mycobacterium] stephanolepidis]